MTHPVRSGDNVHAVSPMTKARSCGDQNVRFPRMTHSGKFTLVGLFVFSGVSRKNLFHENYLIASRSQSTERICC